MRIERCGQPRQWMQGMKHNPVPRLLHPSHRKIARAAASGATGQGPGTGNRFPGGGARRGHLIFRGPVATGSATPLLKNETQEVGNCCADMTGRLGIRDVKKLNSFSRARPRDPSPDYSVGKYGHG